MPKQKQTNEGISALTANTVSVGQYRGKKIYSTIKRPKKSKSPKKRETNERFRQAMEFANQAKKNSHLKQIYLKGINASLRNVYTVALTDFMRSPVIHYINVQKYTGAVGSEFRVKVTDVVPVPEVKYSIINANGNELERGDAVRYDRKPFMWIVTVKTANNDMTGTVIRIFTEDYAGNKVEGSGVVNAERKCVVGGW